MKPTKLCYDARLDDAADAVATDNRKLAKACMESDLIGMSHRAEAWLIKAWTCESLQETNIALQRALEIDPCNETARAGWNWVQGLKKLAETQRESKRGAERQAEEEARAKKEARAKAEAEEVRIQAEIEAQRQAEEEARAEKEARAKAEAEEVRIQTEIEAQRQAEEEARAEKEAEARVKAESEAEFQLKGDAEAELQAQPGQQQESSTQTDTAGQCDAVETKVEHDVVSLANEVRQQIEDDIVNAEIVKTECKNEEDEDVSSPEVTQRMPVVLAVDDSPTIRKLVSLTLSCEGFEVITAENGIDALSILAERLPDIILSDINMPKLDGYKLCKFVKKHERTQAIPVVMLSGKDGMFDKMRGKMSGCNDFIAKPFDSAELVEKVRQQLAAVNN